MLIIGNRLANEHTNEMKQCNGSTNQMDIRYSIHGSPIKPNDAVKSQSPTTATTPATANSSRPDMMTRDDAQMVDFASSFLFPLSFVIFNIIYWVN